MENFIGTILMFAGNFAPKDWAFCNGQVLAISQNQALFSILGTTYGGDGITNFKLPDLRGCLVMGAGPNNPEGQSGTFATGNSGTTNISAKGVVTHSNAGTSMHFSAIHFVICMNGVFPPRT